MSGKKSTGTPPSLFQRLERAYRRGRAAFQHGIAYTRLHQSRIAGERYGAPVASGFVHRNGGPHFYED